MEAGKAYLNTGKYTEFHENCSLGLKEKLNKGRK